MHQRTGLGCRPKRYIIDSMIATGCAIECRAGELSMCVVSSSHSSPPSGYAITMLCNKNVPTFASRAARCNLPVPRIRTWVFRSQAPGAVGSGGIAVAAWITASHPAKITGNRDSRPRSSRSTSANSSPAETGGEQLLRFSLIANQTEHLVSSSKQLGNQSASENPSGTRDGYSQLATPTFIFTLLILIAEQRCIFVCAQILVISGTAGLDELWWC